MLVRFQAASAAIAAFLLATACSGAPDSTQQVGANTGANDPAQDPAVPPTTQPHFTVTTLVTDKKDPDLVNPWGLVGAEGVFWIADNGTGKVSVYDGDGKTSDEYPTGHFALGAPITGAAAMESDDKGAFVVGSGTACAAPAELIFASQEGTLIATNDETPRTGTVVADRSHEGAIYLGVAKIDSPSGPMLLAADFANGRIDRFDERFQLISTDCDVAFHDDQLPAGYGPFNVMAFGDRVYVTYALGENGEEQPAPGRGQVDIFDTSGKLLTRIKSSMFNTPWGVAPSAAGLFVGNFGDGRITMFDPTTYEALGQLTEADGHPIVLPGLWGLAMGSEDAGDPSALYFAAGPEDETAGQFGRIDRVR